MGVNEMVMKPGLYVNGKQVFESAMPKDMPKPKKKAAAKKDKKSGKKKNK